MPFDKDSGLVYKEQTVRRPRCRHVIEHEKRLPQGLGISHWNNNGPAQGTKSLARTAISSLLCHVEQLDTKALRRLPEHIVDLLWHSLTRAGADTLHAWLVFAQTARFGRTLVRTFACACVPCSRRLLGISSMSPVSTQAKWLTTLTLSNSPYSTSEMIDVAKLDNLRHFFLQTNRRATALQKAALSDRIVKAWATESRIHGALSRLETMIVDSQEGLTLSSLQYLHAFPALDYFCARNCHIQHGKRLRAMASEAGWYLDQGEDEDGRSFYQYMKLHFSRASARRNWSSLVYGFLQHRRGALAKDDVPMLDMVVSDSTDAYRANDVPFFQGNVDEVVCLRRILDHQPGPAPLEVPDLPSKRRKLNNRKSATFDNLLLGLT